MSDTTKVLVRNARDQDMPVVAEIDAEAFGPYGTAEKPETFQRRLEAFPNGFIVLVDDYQVQELDEEIALRPETSVTFLKLVPLVGG